MILHQRSFVAEKMLKRKRDDEEDDQAMDVDRDEDFGRGGGGDDDEAMNESNNEPMVALTEAEAVSRVVPSERVYRKLTVLDSLELQRHLERIEASDSAFDNDRYDAINASNAFISQIDVDIVAVHKRLRDLYSSRFPELEQTLPNSLDYAKVVRAIGSQTDMRNVDLSDLIPPNAIMVVQMTFTTSSGKPLSEEKMKEVLELTEFIIELYEVRNRIFSYIEKQMSALAPNVSALVGTHIAARLIGLVGGLEALSRMPGCNVMIIGSVENKVSTGLASFGSKHRGIVFQSELVQSAPSDLQRKILKIVSSKLVLAARVDISRENSSLSASSSSSDEKGELGLRFKEEIEKKIAKMQEPPPKKQKKALPVPLEKPRKKRGGAKYRRMRERLQTTDLQRQKNRMGFNQAEDDDYGSELGMGLLGSKDSGRVRIAGQDTQRLSKGNHQLVFSCFSSFLMNSC
jgi:U4/U6 small nuclear ribonucleoprotein PRP31